MAWPASRKSLREFIAIRAIGGAGIRWVKADTIQGNLAVLRLIHIDHQLDATVSDDPWLQRVVAGVRRVEPTATRKQAAPMCNPP